MSFGGHLCDHCAQASILLAYAVLAHAGQLFRFLRDSDKLTFSLHHHVCQQYHYLLSRRRQRCRRVPRSTCFRRSTFMPTIPLSLEGVVVVRGVDDRLGRLDFRSSRVLRTGTLQVGFLLLDSG
jgi:hypothetical protein